MRALKNSGIPIRLTIVAAVIGLAAAHGIAQTTKPTLPLQGKLVQTARGPMLRVKGRGYPLRVARTWHLNTLKDARLANREIRVEGVWAADGTLEASQFYTVKNGKLHRVRYYCEVCNIESLEPGDCVCCQAPTELQEIAIDE